MKKILSFVLSLTLILSLCACGENEPEDATQEATEAVEEKATEAFDFTDIGLGNDPANFANSAYSPAFDESYIYYNDGLNSGIYRINYTGEGKALVTEGENMYLNIHENFLYYVYDADYVMEVYRVDTSTLEEERVFMDDGYNNSAIEPFTMLVTDNIILYAYSDLDAHAAVAYNMDTEEHITLVSDWEEVSLITITMDENKEIFIWRTFPDGKSDLHRISLDEIQKYEASEADGEENISIAKKAPVEDYAEIEPTSDLWHLDGGCIKLKSNANSAPGEIYFAKDITAPEYEKVCDTAYFKYENRLYEWNTYGAYKGKLYLIEAAGLYDTDEGEKLTVVDSKGKYKRYNVK